MSLTQRLDKRERFKLPHYINKSVYPVCSSSCSWVARSAPFNNKEEKKKFAFSKIHFYMLLNTMMIDEFTKACIHQAQAKQFKGHDP